MIDICNVFKWNKTKKKKVRKLLQGVGENGIILNNIRNSTSGKNYDT